MGEVHDFRKSLEASYRYAEAPWWADVYRQAFPGFASMVCVRNDGWAQRGGIDRVITLRSGKTLTVDEKVRERDYGDIALERWSNEARKEPGWVQKDLACDFIAYAIAPTRTCYLLPFLPLRRAWIDHGREWCARYPEIRANNRNYVTVSVGVPVGEVFAALGGAMTANWQDRAA